MTEPDPTPPQPTGPPPVPAPVPPQPVEPVEPPLQPVPPTPPDVPQPPGPPVVPGSPPPAPAVLQERQADAEGDGGADLAAAASDAGIEGETAYSSEYEQGAAQPGPTQT